jgi:hypothetical protein
MVSPMAFKEKQKAKSEEFLSIRFKLFTKI